VPQQGRAHGAEHSVTGGVALYVVDPLEVVDVEEDQDQGLPGSAHVVDRHDQLVAARRALQDARELVPVGAVAVLPGPLAVECGLATVEGGCSPVPRSEHPVDRGAAPRPVEVVGYVASLSRDVAGRGLGVPHGRPQVQLVGARTPSPRAPAPRLRPRRPATGQGRSRPVGLPRQDPAP